MVVVGSHPASTGSRAPRLPRLALAAQVGLQGDHGRRGGADHAVVDVQMAPRIDEKDFGASMQRAQAIIGR
jgi:hypothetical protein